MLKRNFLMLATILVIGMAVYSPAESSVVKPSSRFFWWRPGAIPWIPLPSLNRPKPPAPAPAPTPSPPAENPPPSGGDPPPEGGDPPPEGGDPPPEEEGK